MLTPSRLKAVTGLQEAVELVRELGYRGNPIPIDAEALNLGTFVQNRALRSESSRARGSGVLIAEVEARPPSLKALGKRLLQNFHDQPLALLGIPDPDGRWGSFIVARPAWVRGVLNAVRLSKLEVDVTSPTRHDAAVLSSIAWSGEDRDAHDRIDRALDVEAVTKRFFLGLAEHHEALIDAVRAATETDGAVLAGVKEAGGVERVALRILTQMLFCWFLQRKHLLGGNADHLRNRFLRRTGDFYPTVLEPMFYDALAKPIGDRAPTAPGPEVPFLNGGLFQRHYGHVSLPLPDEVFDLDRGLLGFLEGWTFTIAEDVPDEVEVAVDPEMLGKVFENLISDEEARRQGTVYTPRPVVHFMCREALVPWLQHRLGIDEERARWLLVDDEAFERIAREGDEDASLDLASELDGQLRELTVLDPAVGSGAFLLGMMAEIVRLRRMALRVLAGREATPAEITEWKLRAIEHSLFGVDINATAIELCRLRMWLSLIVDLPEDAIPHPLPNLEHRTVVANSLTDFVNGIEVQNTREGQAGGLEVVGMKPDIIMGLRRAYFEASDPQVKETIRQQLALHEDLLIDQLFGEAQRQGDQSGEALQQLAELSDRFRSWDREFPAFMPGFHAPDIWAAGGWDVAIMNPPYLGRKEVAQHIDPMRRADYERHFGDLNDLMILFARRAQQLTRVGGVISMIFNDSIFTSTDAEDLRHEMFERNDVLACARTRCFEGKAVNGGVVLFRRSRSYPPSPLRWVEGYKRPTTDFASASDPLPFADEVGRFELAGSMEVFSAPGNIYHLLPHRPMFRPSAEAIQLLDRFPACDRWSTIGTSEGWSRLSNTRALEREIQDLQRQGWYDRLKPGQWVLLGYVIEGGQGLATADDKHFIGTIEGTDAAEEHLRNQQLLEQRLESDPPLQRKYDRLRSNGKDREEALLALWDDLENDAILAKLWPRTASFRLAPRDLIRREPLTEAERIHGIASGPFWVPFEKGDSSQDVENEEGRVTSMGARWTRRNPLVIDWSVGSVRLLRRRGSSQNRRRKPRVQNEDLWFCEGVTWNRVTSYLRCRAVPPTGIFSDKTPLIRPRVDWLNSRALLALLNTAGVDFLLRTFLGSRMMIEIGDVRQLPVPVLSEEQNRYLSSLAERAVEEKLAADRGDPNQLSQVEREIDRYVRAIYRIDEDAVLWVVR